MQSYNKMHGLGCLSSFFLLVGQSFMGPLIKVSHLSTKGKKSTHVVLWATWVSKHRRAPTIQALVATAPPAMTSPSLSQLVAAALLCFSPSHLPYSFPSRSCKRRWPDHQIRRVVAAPHGCPLDQCLVAKIDRQQSVLVEEGVCQPLGILTHLLSSSLEVCLQ